MTTVLIAGASARAAAWSAVRAGLSPRCFDLFADLDLRAVAPVEACPPGRYPEALAGWLASSPPGPWLFVGGLENRPLLVRRCAAARPLWGVGGAALAAARDPFHLATLGLSFPDVRPTPPAGPGWLVKPLGGAGGAGVRRHDPAVPPPRRPVYYQRYVDGTPAAAVYLATAAGCRLLGVTRQLVGEAWLHARPFAYCGSVGPLELPPAAAAHLDRVGRVLAEACHLRGLFGVDFVLASGGRQPPVSPVEVNPRYTASVEVLEYARGLPALALHRTAFDDSAPPPTPGPAGPPVVGKAVVFAPADVTVPVDGPWEAAARAPDVAALPRFTDVPPSGTPVAAGRPVLTVWASAATEADCVASLRDAAAGVDEQLIGP